jgi:hypothetical protein
MRKLLPVIFLAAMIAPALKAQSNVAKLGLGELLSLKPSLQYERIINERTSANLTMNFRPSISLPSFFYENVLNVNDNPAFETSHFAIYPEFRLYTGFNIAPEGFYIGFQGKYAKTNFDLNGLILDETDTHYEGSVTSAGGGLQFGHQWLINEKLTVDFYFIGFSIQKTTISGTVTSTNSNADFESMETSLEESVENIPVLNKLEATSTDNSLVTELGSLSLGLRTGVSLGITF